MSDDESMAAPGVRAGSGRHIRTKTLRTITADEVTGIIGRLG